MNRFAEHLVPEKAWLLVRPRRVVEQHIDFLGHVNNLVWLDWVIQLGADHSIAWGYDLPDLQALGGTWVVRKHSIEYLKSAFEGEELVEVTWLSRATGVQNIRQCRIFNASGELCVRAQTDWAFSDPATGKPLRTPKEVRESYSVAPEGFEIEGSEALNFLAGRAV